MNLQFSNIEFKRMAFNPIKYAGPGSLFKVFPKLSKYKIFKKSPGPDLNNERVMLYIICLYEKNTPYRPKYLDVLQRKIEVAHDVGFEVGKDGLFDDAVEIFMKGGNAIVNAKIVEFVRMHRNFKYSYLVGIENSYYTIMKEIMSGNTKRLSELKDIQEELEDTMIQLMNDDNNPYIRDTILRYLEEERLGVTPEEIALKIAKNEQPVSFEEVQRYSSS